MLLSSFAISVGPSMVGFGNVAPGLYQSEWEAIHVTTASDLATVLPYWPPSPVAPKLTFDDKGPGVKQGIDFDAGLLALAYFSSDAVTPYLTANGTTLTGAKTSDPSSGTGQHHFDFDNLSADQTTTGWLVAEEFFGRTRTGPSATCAIPDR